MSRRGENIYKRKDKRYEGRYIKGYDEKHHAVYGYVYAKTYSQVREKLSQLKAQTKIYITKTDISLGEWVLKWLTERNNIKESTRFLYSRHIQNHIIPCIGKTPLKSVNTDILHNFVMSLDMSPSTVRLICAILKQAIKSAAENGFCADCSAALQPPKKERSETVILTKQQQQRLEASLVRTNEVGILICLYMGLRIGELCALKWSDIDFENSCMYIRGTQYRKNGVLTVTTPKTRSSVRVVPIPHFICDMLSETKRESEFVISHGENAVDVRSYRRRFKSILKKSQLPDIKFHALRHTFASRALEVGMDYKTLSELLGHASVAVTMDLYVHPLDEHKKNEMQKLEALHCSPSV